MLAQTSLRRANRDEPPQQRPINLELSNSLAIADASTWAQYSNGWRTGGDIECYGCEPSGSSYPLTDWATSSPGSAVPLTLAAGANTIEFSNPTAYAPDFDRITVAGSPGR